MMIRILQGIFGIFGRVKSYIIGYYDCRRRRRCQRFQDFRLGIFSNRLGFVSILPLEKHRVCRKICNYRCMNMNTYICRFYYVLQTRIAIRASRHRR